MKRPSQRQRSSASVRDAKGYTRGTRTSSGRQSTLIEREVGTRKNSLTGLTAGAERMASTMKQGTQQITQTLQGISQGLSEQSDIQTRGELIAIEKENKKLTLQAALDHARGNSYASDRESYTFERRRLEAADEIRKANEAKARARAAAAASSKKKKNAPLTPQQEMDALATPVDQMGTLEGSAKKAVVHNSVQKAAVEIDTYMNSNGASADPLENQAVVREIVMKHTDGMPEDMQASVYSDVTTLTDTSMRKRAVERAVADQEEAQTEILETVRGDYTNGDLYTEDQIDTHIGNLMAVIPGPEKRRKKLAAAAVTNKVIQVAGERAALGDTYAIYTATEALGKYVTPEMEATKLLPIQESVDKAITKRVQTRVAEVQQLLAAGDTVAALALHRQNLQYQQHPSYQTANKALAKHLEDEAEKTANREAFENVAAGKHGDILKATVFATPIIENAIRNNDLSTFVITTEAIGSIPKDAATMITHQLNVDGSQVGVTKEDEDGMPIEGPSVEAYRAVAMLKSLPARYAKEALSSSAYAYYQALMSEYDNSGVKNFTLIKQDVDAYVREKGTDKLVQATTHGAKPADLYPDMKTEDAEAQYSADVAGAVEALYPGLKVDSPSALEARVADEVALSSAFSRGGYTNVGERIQIAVEAELAGMVPVPMDAKATDAHSSGKFAWSVDADVTKYASDKALTPVHDNKQIARQGAAFWRGKERQIDPDMSKASTKAGHLFSPSDGATFMSNPISSQAAKGFMRVVGGVEMGDLAGVPVRVAPGSTVSNGADTTKYPVDPTEFRRFIGEENGKLMDSGYVWLRMDDSEMFPKYHLTYRPSGGQISVGEHEKHEDMIMRETDAFVRDLEIELDEFSQQQLIDSPIWGIKGMRGDPNPELNKHLRSLITEAQTKVDSPVSLDWGVNQPIPTFKNVDEAVGWLQSDFKTQIATERDGRPFTPRPETTDEQNILEFMKGRNGFSLMPTKAPGSDTAKVAGGVPVSSQWTHTKLAEMGVSAQTIRNLEQGVGGLDLKAAQALSVEAYKEGEKRLKDAGIKSSPDMSWETYSVLAGVAIETPKAISKELVGLANAKDWRGLAEHLRGMKHTSKAMERKRYVDAMNILTSIGYKP